MDTKDKDRPTRYSQLKSGTRGASSAEYFEGKWKGRDVKFPRVFRGHRFTDAECAALCAGERIEVHNIEGKSGPYAVQGMLTSEESIFGLRTAFKVIDTVPNRVNFRFGETPLYSVSESYKPVEKVVDLDDDYDDYGYNPDDGEEEDLRGEIRDIKAQLAEMMKHFITATDRSGDGGSGRRVQTDHYEKPKIKETPHMKPKVSRQGRKYGAESRAEFVSEMMAPSGSRAHAAAAFARILMLTSGETVIAADEDSHMGPQEASAGFGMSGYTDIREKAEEAKEGLLGPSEGTVDTGGTVSENKGSPLPDHEDFIEGRTPDEDII